MQGRLALKKNQAFKFKVKKGSTIQEALENNQLLKWALRNPDGVITDIPIEEEKTLFNGMSRKDAVVVLARIRSWEKKLWETRDGYEILMSLRVLARNTHVSHQAGSDHHEDYEEPRTALAS